MNMLIVCDKNYRMPDVNAFIQAHPDFPAKVQQRLQADFEADWLLAKDGYLQGYNPDTVALARIQKETFAGKPFSFAWQNRQIMDYDVVTLEDGTTVELEVFR